MDINTTFLTCLRDLARQHTLNALGDRRTYLGASDIGHCPRRVILERIKPREYDLTSLLRFERGHMAEEIVAKVFSAAGYTNFERQVEIETTGCEAPFLVHIDFVFTSEERRVKAVLEVKSSDIPPAPYSSWEMQLYAQMGAVSEKYPDYAVKGAILCLDLTDGELGLFTGYLPDTATYQSLMERACKIWSIYQAMLLGENIEPETEPGLLCGFCDFLIDCPIYSAREAPHMAEVVESLDHLRIEANQLKAKMKPIQKNLLKVVQKIGSIRVNNKILREKSQLRTSFNVVKLDAFLSEVGQSLDDFRETAPTAPWLEIKRCRAA